MPLQFSFFVRAHLSAQGRTEKYEKKGQLNSFKLYPSTALLNSF